MTPRGRWARSRPCRYGRMWSSSPGVVPRPSAAACCGVTMKPEPCSLTPGLEISWFAINGWTAVMSAPTFRLPLILPSRSVSSTTGVSVFSPLSRSTVASVPSRPPRAATVMAMRTAALSAAFCQG